MHDLLVAKARSKPSAWRHAPFFSKRSIDIETLTQWLSYFCDNLASQFLTSSEQVR